MILLAKMTMPINNGIPLKSLKHELDIYVCFNPEKDKIFHIIEQMKD